MKSDRPNLLKHPLVTSFVNEKWRSIGRLIFFTNFILYLTFLISLTVHAISVTAFSPSKQACKYTIKTQTPAVQLNQGRLATYITSSRSEKSKLGIQKYLFLISFIDLASCLASQHCMTAIGRVPHLMQNCKIPLQVNYSCYSFSYDCCPT